MRLLAGFTLLGLAIASSFTWEPTRHINENRFVVGREYRYLFNGQVTTGLALPNTQHSATRLQALVTLQPVDERLVVLHISKIRFGSLQEELEPHQMLPFERFQTLKLDKQHEDMLNLPIRFSYRHGMISDIEFSDEDKAWSVNIKKAVLNMLQINLLKRDEIMRNDRVDETYNKNFFVTTERTLEGECEVEYTVNEDEAKFTEWTKSINFQKCNVRPEVQYGVRPYDFKKTNEDKLFSTVYKHKMTGNKDEFLIYNAELESIYRLNPVSNKHELITSHVINKISLVYAGKTETHIPRVRTDRKENLMYNMDWELYEEKFAMTGDEKYLAYIPEWRNKLEHIEKLLTTMNHRMVEKVELEHTHLFARLVKLLRLCREQELVKIQRFLENHENINDKTLALYYDALAMAGTKVTVGVLMKKITEEKVDSLKAARLLKSLSEVRIPSEMIAEEVLRVCESDVAERTSYLKQSCWLTYGSIFNSYCNNYRLATHQVDNVCRRELKEKVVRRLVDIFKRSETRHEKVLMLKALANTGIDFSVHELENIIYDKKEEKTVRIEAIYAMRRLRNMMPRKIQNILMPIYKRRTEYTEVRIAALRMIMKTSPEQGVIDQVIRQMEVERDKHLRAFVYRMLSTIAEHPEIDKGTVRCVEKSLRTIDKEFYENLNRYVVRYTTKDMDDRYGLTWGVHSLFTKDSVLPKDIRTSLDSIFGGEWYKHFLEIGISQQNVDELLHKVLGKLQENNIEHLIVRGKRSTFYRPTDILRNIYEKLNFIRRHSDKEKTHAMVYLRYKDMDYAFLPIDVDTIPTIIKNMFRDGKLQLDEVEGLLATGFHFTKTGGFYLYEYVRKVPTTTGLPLVLTSKMPTVATIQGHVNIDMEPKESQVFDGLRLRFILKPKIATTHVVRAVVLSPIIESGFKMLHSATLDLPLETESELTWKHKLHMNTRFLPLKHKKNVMHLQSRPVTFIRHMKKNTHVYPEPVEITVHLREQFYPVYKLDNTYFKKYGTAVELVGTMNYPVARTLRRMLNPMLIGHNIIDINMEPTEDAPKEYTFHMQMESFVPVRMEKPDFRTVFKSEEMLDMDRFDSDERQEGVRQLHGSYFTDFEIEKVYKHRLFFAFETVGQREQKRAEMELDVSCDNKLRFCRTLFAVRRTPLDREDREWEMRIEAQALYPEFPRSLKQLRDGHNTKFMAIADAIWGSEHKNKLSVRIEGDQSRQQKMWMKTFEREENKLAEIEKLKIAREMNLYKLVAKYKLTSETEYYMNKLFTVLKSSNWWRTEYENARSNDGVLRAVLEIEPLNRRMFDLFIVTPNERVTMRRLRMPVKLPTVDVHDMHMLEFANVKDVIRHVEKRNRAECVVRSREINTFDNLLLRTPLSTCYTVLAKDCSSEEPRFVVLMKKIAKDSEEKELKMVTRQDVYVIRMLKDLLMVNINDHKIRFEEFVRYGIHKLDDLLYKIELDGVTVIFDGMQVNIKLSHLYKNKQCGICGHYDGEKWNDLRRADNEETNMVDDFHRSYITKDNDCEIDEEGMRLKHNEHLEKRLKHHNYHHNSDSDDFDYEEGQKSRKYKEDNTRPVQRTDVIERNDMICFSVEPVEKCPEHMRKEDMKREEVEFVCLNESREARRLMHRAREEVLPRHLLQNGHSWRTTIHVPKMCTVY